MSETTEEPNPPPLWNTGKPRARLYDAITTDEMRARQDELKAQGFGTFSPEFQAAMPRLWQLRYQQPSGTPDTFPAPLGGLYDPPSDIASTARWRRWRDGMAESAFHSDDPNYSAFLQAADALLAWRAALAPEDHFWRPDEE